MRFRNRKIRHNSPERRIDARHGPRNQRKFSRHFDSDRLALQYHFEYGTCGHRRYNLPDSVGHRDVRPNPGAQTQNLAAAPAAPPAAGFVGSDACKTCHADVWLNFYKNPHYKSIASGKEPPERTGCEGCHGRAKAHVEARGGKATIPHAFSLMEPKQVLEDCLGCHAPRFGARQHPPLGAHAERRGLHQLPFHPPFAHAQISAGQDAERPLLLVPRHHPRAVRHALQASRERRLHAVHGLPQSARGVRGHLGHGAAAAHDGAGADQRGAVPEVPRR